jgi:hypothetical protein
MSKFGRFLVVGLIVVGLSAAFVCGGVALAQTAGEKGAPKKEITQEELAASVPTLHDLHDVVFPLWHKAYAEKDYALIKQLLPRADTLVTKLDEAALPGILRDRQEKWDAGKANLKSALEQLHQAAEADDQEAMLKQVEAFHASYERLVRTIRPVVPALDAFHQELYKLYHYYAPQYDLEKIRAAAAAMKEKMPALKEAQLSKRLADRQADFDAAVKELDAAVDQLAETVKVDSKEKIKAAVEKVHTAYQKTEKLFD